MSCNEVTTGITTSAEISNTPIIGIATATVRAANKIRIILIARVGIPPTWAASSSNVIYVNSL